MQVSDKGGKFYRSVEYFFSFIVPFSHMHEGLCIFICICMYVSIHTEHIQRSLEQFWDLEVLILQCWKSTYNFWHNYSWFFVSMDSTNLGWKTVLLTTIGNLQLGMQKDCFWSHHGWMPHVRGPHVRRGKSDCIYWENTGICLDLGRPNPSCSRVSCINIHIHIYTNMLMYIQYPLDLWKQGCRGPC